MNILLTEVMAYRASHLFYHLKEEHNVIGFDIKNGDILKTEFPKDIDLVIHLLFCLKLEIVLINLLTIGKQML